MHSGFSIIINETYNRKVREPKQRMLISENIS